MKLNSLPKVISYYYLKLYQGIQFDNETYLKSEKKENEL